MSAQTHSTGQDLARARTLRIVAIVIAVAAFGTLVYGFGMNWQPLYQVAAGLAAYAGIEWQRQLGKRIKELSGGG